MSELIPQPKGHDMSRFWRLVHVDGGRVTGIWWVRPLRSIRCAGFLLRGESIVTAIDVVVYHDDARTWGRVVRELTAWVTGDEVRIPEHMIDPHVRADVFEELDHVKASVLAAARAVNWGDA